MFMIRRAVEKDLFQVKRLLREAEMNDKGLEEHLAHFFVVETVAESGNHAKIVGACGMEVYEPYGLLRSFVLERASWNSRVGLQLVHILLSYAGHLDLSHVYLVAGSTPAFFEQIGFSVISVEDLPEEIQTSDHIEQSISKGIPMVYACFPSRQH